MADVWAETALGSGRKPHEQTEHTKYYSKLKNKTIKALTQDGIQTILLTDLIGHGGMGAVFKAVWNRSYGEEVVAVKILDPRQANDNSRSRFNREAKTTNSFKQDNIVPCHAYGTSEIEIDSVKKSVDFLVMDYIETKNYQKADGPLEISLACKITQGAAQGLMYAHQRGFIHRDIKPDNILLTKTGEVKVTDFGLVKVLYQDETIDMDMTKTAEGMALGTPHYMSPEQGKGSKIITKSTDIYSLGATLYEFISGKTPFEGLTSREIINKIIDEEPESIRKLNPKVPEDLEEIVLRAMAKEPGQRQNDMKEFLDELEALKTQPLDEDSLKELQKRLEKSPRYTTKEENEKAMLFIEAMKRGTLNIIDFSPEPMHWDIITESRKIERQSLEKKMLENESKRDKGFYDDIALARDGYERLLEITPRTKDNVSKRIRWLEEARKVYEKAGGKYWRDVESLTNKLAWENSRKDYYKKLYPDIPEIVEKPKEQETKSFIEKHSKKIVLSSIGAVVLIVLAGAAGLIGYFHYQSAEQRREKDRQVSVFNNKYRAVTGMIEAFNFEASEKDLKILRSMAGGLNDENLGSKVDELEELNKKKKEEKNFSDLYSVAQKKVEEAQSLVEKSYDQNTGNQEKNRLLLSARSLIDEVEKEYSRLRRDDERDLREKTDGLKKKIGDKLPALEQYAAAIEKYNEVEEKYKTLQKGLEESVFFERTSLTTLREELQLRALILKNESVQKHFPDDPSYAELIRNLQRKEKDLTSLDRDLSLARFEAAKKELGLMGETTAWLMENYFLEEAEKKAAENDGLVKSIGEHLDNINDDFFSFSRSSEALRKTLGEATTACQSARIRYEEFRDMKKKAESGDDSSRVAMGKLFFDKGDLGKSELYLAAVADGELKTQIVTYLEIFNLEKDIQKPENLNYKKTQGGYDTDLLTKFNALIEIYQTSLTGEKEILENLKQIKSETDSGSGLDTHKFGELHEDAVLKREGAKEKLAEFLKGIYQSAQEELQQQEPDILQRRARLYEAMGKTAPEKK